ncbi:hypothetical protein Tsubulata_015189 [Turnera subulata]|uniref:Uncharacterized protein n=1 Tax=Turnera subulata TaxID=218843 RepID=A0A9Q0J2M1_9ROSI|nr:hypothetical protein Tsubulata_015189 [Turnera subulata]
MNSPSLTPALFHSVVLPRLKHSLSLTLLHFLPLACNLTWPSHASKPFLLYTPSDGVALTVAESDADFHHLSGYHIQEVEESVYYVLDFSVTDSVASAMADPEDLSSLYLNLMAIMKQKLMDRLFAEDNVEFWGFEGNSDLEPDRSDLELERSSKDFSNSDPSVAKEVCGSKGDGGDAEEVTKPSLHNTNHALSPFLRHSDSHASTGFI